MLVCTLTVKKNLFLEFNLLKDEKCFQIKILEQKWHVAEAELKVRQFFTRPVRITLIRAANKVQGFRGLCSAWGPNRSGPRFSSDKYTGWTIK